MLLFDVVIDDLFCLFQDVQVQVGDGIDYSEFFNINNICFDSYDHAFNYANAIALGLKFHLVKSSNHGEKGLKRNFVHCDRHYLFRSKAKSNSLTPKRLTSSKKCDCKFRIKIIEDEKTHKFGIVPHYGFHNHNFLPYLDGHSRRAKMSPEVKEKVKSSLKAHVSPKNIKAGLMADLKKRMVADGELGVDEFPTEAQYDQFGPNLKALYNLNSRMSKEERGDRNRAQQMFQLARNHDYVYFHKVDQVTSEVTHVFMIHPEALKMFRAWPYVIVIDSTYKTNVYGIPLVEIIGVSPVGSNFLVGYALMVDESTDSYEWLLQQVKKLLLDVIAPSAIVTDRELGLIGAIPKVFPTSGHLLCIFHIYRAIEAYVLNYDKTLVTTAKILTYGMFGRIVRARTVDDCLEAWNDFTRSYGRRFGQVVKYVHSTWMCHVDKWARCYTDQHLHLKNYATSRVESAHAVLKSWVRSSTVGLDSLFNRAHTMMVVQHSDLRKLLSDSHGKRLNFEGPVARLLSLVNGSGVSFVALRIMEKEFVRGTMLGIGLASGCGCWMTPTRGLPCACRLHDLHNRGRKVHIEDIHVFWRTLVYGEGQIAVADDVDDVEAIMRSVRDLDPTMLREVREKLHSILHPEEDDIREPAYLETRRGRPKNTTSRTKSHWEKHKGVAGTPSSGKVGVTSSSRGVKVKSSANVVGTSSTVDYDSGTGAPLEINFVDWSVGGRDAIQEALPPWFTLFYGGYFDPDGDGHCGYRCLSHATQGDQKNWLAMRRALCKEITSRRGYLPIYGYETVKPIYDAIYWDNPGPCGERHYMSNTDLFGFATLHSWVICVVVIEWHNGALSWRHSQSYMPISAPPGVRAPLGELWLVLQNKHWRRIHVRPDTTSSSPDVIAPPMPPFCRIWRGWPDKGIHVHDPSVEDWMKPYEDRVNSWKALVLD